MTYHLTDLHAPVLRGAALQAVVLALESPLGGPLAEHTFRLMGLGQFRRAAVDDDPLFQPAPPRSAEAPPPPAETLAAWARSLETAGVPSRILAFHRAYREGRWTPVDAADAFLRAWAASEQEAPALRAFTAVHAEDLRAQAEAATQRWQQGQPLSVLDGVPIAVKDETAVQGYPTTWGIRAREDRRAPQDATVVARLRALGALIVGKTNMHEGGIGVTGHNVHYGTARNPYAPDHYPGGSSSGSAVATVAGLVPAALGGDAGGSIRVPAAFCGGVGLKPTFGRVSRFSPEPLDWSVAHLGPLAALPGDAALLLAAVAGPDPRDPATQGQPRLQPPAWDADLHGLTVGVYWPWFRHAAPEVVAANEVLVQALARAGAQVREVVLPDLAEVFAAHLVVTGTELAATLGTLPRAALGWEVRNTTALARYFRAADLLHAQRWRARWVRHVEAALAQVDVLLTPATGLAAPRIPPDEAEVSNLGQMAAIMRFVSPFNLSGHPAMVFPAGYTPDGRPVGMQAIGRYWDEAPLLRLAWVAGTLVERRPPRRDYSAQTLPPT